MSGPYKGALFSASSYDADDGMFPLAYGLFSSKNYEDWLWFLEKLKMVIGERDVIIISDRHQGIIVVFQRKGKENALQMLDSIAMLVQFARKYTLEALRTLVTHDMPMIDEDGTVRDALGHTYPFLNPPTTKRPPGRPRKRRIVS
ncbi:hypothetical protein CK203_059727 [Vitis vinifera]|uniref:MULE transposase domain-containing protein n=1 Tax=Vitis vinifera TaxID=29760 RepID=A0A438G7K3_VITVI|nr:hypothetical protein CK203_059727 [Vitis vinifera]